MFSTLFQERLGFPRGFEIGWVFHVRSAGGLFRIASRFMITWVFSWSRTHFHEFSPFKDYCGLSPGLIIGFRIGFPLVSGLLGVSTGFRIA